MVCVWPALLFLVNLVTPSQVIRCSSLLTRQKRTPARCKTCFDRLIFKVKQDLHRPSGAAQAVMVFALGGLSSRQLFCLFSTFISYLHSTAKNPAAAHFIARLRVAAGCGLSLFLYSNALANYRQKIPPVLVFAT